MDANSIDSNFGTRIWVRGAASLLGFELDGFEMMGSNTIDSNWGIGLWIRGAASFLGFELGQGDGFEHRKGNGFEPDNAHSS